MEAASHRRSRSGYRYRHRLTCASWSPAYGEWSAFSVSNMPQIKRCGGSPAGAGGLSFLMRWAFWSFLLLLPPREGSCGLTAARECIRMRSVLRSAIRRAAAGRRLAMGMQHSTNGLERLARACLLVASPRPRQPAIGPAKQRSVTFRALRDVRNRERWRTRFRRQRGSGGDFFR